jgi:hypothetical protein
MQMLRGMAPEFQGFETMKKRAQIDKTWWGMQPTGVCPPQLSAEKRQDQLIADWAKTLPAKERRVVEALPKLANDHRPTGQDKDAAEVEGVREFVDPLANLRRQSETPDMAATIDSEHDILMEQFGLARQQAEAVCMWANQREHDAARTMQAKVLGAILGQFLGQKTADANTMFWALAFQSGVARHLTRHNPNSKAKELGVTRALMSYWQKVWEAELGLHDLTYAKTDEAREKYREARKAYVSKTRAA